MFKTFFKKFIHSQHTIGKTSCNHLYFRSTPDAGNSKQLFHWFIERDYAERVTGFRFRFGGIQGNTPLGIGFEDHCGRTKYHFGGKIYRKIYLRYVNRKIFLGAKS